MDSRYILKFRRRREGKTNYKHRYRLLLSGKPRLIVRLTNKRIIVQIAEYSKDGDRTIAYFSSDKLSDICIKNNYKNRFSAYLSGYIIGKAVSGKVKEAVLDIGLHKHHPKGKIYSVLKGAVDAGLNIPHNDSILPDMNMITNTNGKDISKNLEDCIKKIDKDPFSFLKSTEKTKKESGGKQVKKK